MPLAADMTVPAAARALGCSAPTVRALVADGLLKAVATERGKRTFLSIDRVDVDVYIAKHGTFTRRRRRAPEEHDELVAEVRALRELVERRDHCEQTTEVVALREALQLQRAAMAAMQEADDARMQGVRMLREAMASFEQADITRSRAVALLDDVVGSLTLPGDTSSLKVKP